MAERIKWLDIAKGIGIVSVVYGHCTQSLCNELFLYIYSFHMPLFFFISGLCFNKYRYSKKDNTSDFITKRTTQLVIPLIVSMALFCLLNQFLNLGTYSIDKLCSFCFPPAMWFVFALIVINLVYFVLNMLSRANRYLDYTLIALSFILSFLIAETGCQLPANLVSVPSGMFFFVSGILLKDYINKYHHWLSGSRHKYIVSVVLLLVPLLYISFFSTPINLADGVIPYFVVLPLCMAFIGIMAIFTVSIIIEQYHSTIVSNLLCYLGQNTLIILMFHMFFIKVSSDYLRPLLGGIGTEPLTVWIWLFITIPIVNRYLPFLAGKGFAKDHC